MGKIISINEINRAVMEGKDDLVFELCKVFDHESYFDPIFDPPESLSLIHICNLASGNL